MICLKFFLIFFAGVIYISGLFSFFSGPVYCADLFSEDTFAAHKDIISAEDISSAEDEFLDYVHSFDFNNALDSWYRNFKNRPDSLELYFQISRYFNVLSENFEKKDVSDKKIGPSYTFDYFIKKGMLIKKSYIDYKDPFYYPYDIKLFLDDNEESGFSKNDFLMFARFLFKNAMFSQARDVYNKLISLKIKNFNQDDMRMFEMARRIDHYLANCLSKAQIFLALKKYDRLIELCRSSLYFTRAFKWPGYFISRALAEKGSNDEALYYLNHFRNDYHGRANLPALELLGNIYNSKGLFLKNFQIYTDYLNEYLSPFFDYIRENKAKQAADFLDNHGIDPEDAEKIVYSALSSGLKSFLSALNDSSKVKTYIDLYELLHSFYSENRKIKFKYSSKVFVIKGKLLFYEKNYSPAVHAFNRAAQLNAFPEEYVFYRARAYLKLKQRDKAVKDLVTASACSADSAAVRGLLAIEFMDEGNTFYNVKTALEHSIKACEYSDYKEYNHLLTLAMAYYKNEMLDRARQIFKLSETMNSNIKALKQLKKLLFP